MTLDRSLQQIAQFPESGGWTGGRYPESRLLSERHRVLNVGDMLLFYYLDETSQTIIVTNMQTTAQDIPAPEIFARQ